VSDTEARMQVHDKYDVIEEQFNRELDGSLHPSGPDSLFGYVAEMRLPAGAVAVDAGCGVGEHAVGLATRFGFQVTGVDPVLRLVQAARRNAPPGSPSRPAPRRISRCPADQLTWSGAVTSCAWSRIWTAPTVSSAAC
jgi:ubiquinone/menaquinone biosynthesis C-methylase UbiE